MDGLSRHSALSSTAQASRLPAGIYDSLSLPVADSLTMDLRGRAMNIRPYRARDSAAWDRLVDGSCNGTFLHSRRFMSYHGKRFQDASLVLEDSGNILGVLPAAVDPADPRRVVSHPGLTYGGLIHRGTHFYGTRMLEALTKIGGWYQDNGFRVFRYKPVPSIYHRRPASDDLYALFRLHAHRYRADLCAVIDLEDRGPLGRDRRAALAKAQSHTVQIAVDPTYLSPLWPILEDQLETRHGVRPTHSLEEIRRLQEAFPDRIQCWAALLNGEVIAGLVLFRTPAVMHAQYSVASAVARQISALDMVFDAAIRQAKDLNIRYFDFGNSNEQEGRVLNDGLHRYKVSLGSGTFVQDFYDCELENWPPPP